jgi:hypothetical protein
MTSQQVTRFDLNEIPALEVRCKCGSVISLSLKKPTMLREKLACMGCNEMLWQHSEMETDRVFQYLNQLVQTLSIWREVQPKQFSVGFSLVDSLTPARASGDRD